MDSPMEWVRRTRLEGEHAPRSLCWRGDELVDWVSGGDAWTADSRYASARRNWGYGRFDAATADATGRWAVVYERTGTAGILLREGKIVREIHRSPYHADAFIYPVCLFAGPDDRVLLAHCPESYARIEIDDADTGERLTRSTSRKEPDFFHSRLAVSRSARRLLSAGWMWHPLDAVVWFDIAAVLRDPALLDAMEGATHSRYVGLAEESSAAWLSDERVVLGGSLEPEDPDQVAELGREHTGPRLCPNGLAVYDISVRNYLCKVDLGYPPGTMMPVGEHHVMTFFQHPRLVSLASGKVVHEWTDLDSGEAVSSIVHEQQHAVLAVDASRTRFAIGHGDGIDVVTIDAAKLPA